MALDQNYMIEGFVVTATRVEGYNGWMTVHEEHVADRRNKLWL